MIISFNRYNGGGGSGSGVTPEQVQQQIDSALTPYWESAVTESAITEAVSGLATEQYVQDALSGVSLEGYWTSAETKTYVDSAVTDTQNQLNEISGMMQSKELVISTAFNQLSDDIAELSGRSVDLSAYWTSAETKDAIDEVMSAITETQGSFSAYTPTSGFSTINGSAITNGGDIVIEGGADMSAYYTSAQTEEAISAATSGKADAANIAANTGNYIFPKWNNQGIISGISQQVFKSYLVVNDGGTGGYFFMNTTKYDEQNKALKLYTPLSAGTAGDILVSTGSGAPVWTNDNKVSSTSVSTIVKLTQAEYDAITTKDPNTFYIIVND